MHLAVITPQLDSTTKTQFFAGFVLSVLGTCHADDLYAEPFPPAL
jgi:hypothetical protein